MPARRAATAQRRQDPARPGSPPWNLSTRDRHMPQGTTKQQLSSHWFQWSRMYSTLTETLCMQPYRPVRSQAGRLSTDHGDRLRSQRRNGPKSSRHRTRGQADIDVRTAASAAVLSNFTNYHGSPTIAPAGRTWTCNQLVVPTLRRAWAGCAECAWWRRHARATAAVVARSA